MRFMLEKAPQGRLKFMVPQLRKSQALLHQIAQSNAEREFAGLRIVAEETSQTSVAHSFAVKDQLPPERSQEFYRKLMEDHGFDMMKGMWSKALWAKAKAISFLQSVQEMVSVKTLTC